MHRIPRALAHTLQKSGIWLNRFGQNFQREASPEAFSEVISDEKYRAFIWCGYRIPGPKTIWLVTLQKLEFVILDRFRRHTLSKFSEVRKNGPTMTYFRQSAFRWYRFGLCVIKTVGGVRRTNWETSVPDRQTDGRTDRQTENNIPFSRGIKTVSDLTDYWHVPCLEKTL